MTNQTINRRAFAIAGIALVAGTKATFAQPATPASPVPATPVSSDATLYRVDIPASSLPATPIAFGAASVKMTPGTVVTYPEGAAGESVAIDHVVAGGYQIRTESELVHIDASGRLTEIPAGETTSVATGETIVLWRNEAEQEFTAGDEETKTITVALFSLTRGSNETSIEGTMEQRILGGTILNTVPESGVIVTVVRSEDAGNLEDTVTEMPFSLDNGEEWTAVVLPLSDD